MKFSSLFRKEPTAAELEIRIADAQAKLEANRARQDDLAFEVLFDQASMVETAKLRELEASLSGELELLERALATLRKREADAEAARLAAEKQARIEAWRRTADEALRQLAEASTGFDSCMSEAGSYLRDARAAAASLANLVHAPENLQGAKFGLEMLVLRESPVHRAIRHHLNITQPIAHLRSTDCSLFDQLCGGGVKGDVAPDREAAETDGAGNDNKGTASETTNTDSLDSVTLQVSL